jgi:uncharacterized membrane protein YfbV (UPF0208 family)
MNGHNFNNFPLPALMTALIAAHLDGFGILWLHSRRLPPWLPQNLSK